MGQAIRPQFNTWTHPSTGEAREYLNNAAEVYGLSVSRYNTGNVSSATLNGERVSNTQARQLLATLEGGRPYRVSVDGGYRWFGRLPQDVLSRLAQRVRLAEGQ